jgi:hypothetical protein
MTASKIAHITHNDTQMKKHGMYQPLVPLDQFVSLHEEGLALADCVIGSSGLVSDGAL